MTKEEHLTPSPPSNNEPTTNTLNISTKAKNGFLFQGSANNKNIYKNYIYISNILLSISAVENLCFLCIRNRVIIIKDEDIEDIAFFRENTREKQRKKNFTFCCILDQISYSEDYPTLKRGFLLY
jgi:hypothetical protein